ncbi:NAD(P)H-dependent oxidoreductase [Desulfocurvibacter africanus]|uniref:NAD(P)H dehydrogenase (Quinone) n=1 Tax=Desulfocurvibacter africanus subsp. africanus str. Walvis Bay TaxID=690850 RepID=F3Z367_DESAF|nr:NAD(P)H-dependent oxidoreductase [Desulfocurvibacter africanus]EGJ50311.1 NAD(P)H dehydrogenase (quinone) [Desulfocurvibacter africanus subsp. africanus str. Walvis Bay]
MRVSIILAHPNPGSLNHGIAQTAAETLRGMGHEVRLRDLYAEGFDPLLPAGEIPREAALPTLVDEHCREIVEADGIVVVHPNWWGMPPAILTGWVDRVIRPGVCYEFVEGDGGEGVPRGLLKARRAVVFNTSNTFEERERAVFGDPLERIWKDCVFRLCGVTDVHRRTFGVVCVSTREQRETWLDEARQIVARLFPKG